MNRFIPLLVCANGIKLHEWNVMLIEQKNQNNFYVNILYRIYSGVITLYFLTDQRRKTAKMNFNKGLDRNTCNSRNTNLVDVMYSPTGAIINITINNFTS